MKFIRQIKNITGADHIIQTHSVVSSEFDFDVRQDPYPVILVYELRFNKMPNLGKLRNILINSRLKQENYPYVDSGFRMKRFYIVADIANEHGAIKPAKLKICVVYAYGHISIKGL